MQTEPLSIFEVACAALRLAAATDALEAHGERKPSAYDQPDAFRDWLREGTDLGLRHSSALEEYRSAVAARPAPVSTGVRRCLTPAAARHWPTACASPWPAPTRPSACCASKTRR